MTVDCSPTNPLTSNKNGKTVFLKDILFTLMAITKSKDTFQKVSWSPSFDLSSAARNAYVNPFLVVKVVCPAYYFRFQKLNVGVMQFIKDITEESDVFFATLPLTSVPTESLWPAAYNKIYYGCRIWIPLVKIFLELKWVWRGMDMSCIKRCHSMNEMICRLERYKTRRRLLRMSMCWYTMTYWFKNHYVWIDTKPLH